MKTTRKKRKYRQLSLLERDRIEAMLSAGHKQKEIAEVLGRNVSTISREITRNRKRLRSRKKGRYKSNLAQSKTVYRRKNASYQGMKIENDERIRRYVINKLKKGWSPDEIAGRMKKNKKFYASRNLIYRWLYSSCAQYYCKFLYSRRYHSKKRKKKTDKEMIPDKVKIEERSEIINQRQRYGDYEGDTIVSGKKTYSKSSLVVAIDRKSRFVSIRKVSSLKPALFVSAINSIEDKVRMKSLTLDNGIENKNHKELNIPTFFCNPYSSWEKGGVENVNKMIRRYIPKGSNISKYSKEYINHIEDLINKKPRKSLGYKSAYEVMLENDMFKSVNPPRKIAVGG